MCRKGKVMFFDKQEFKKKREKEYQYVREVLDFGWHNTKSAGDGTIPKVRGLLEGLKKSLQKFLVLSMRFQTILELEQCMFV